MKGTVAVEINSCFPAFLIQIRGSSGFNPRLKNS